jgi:hypothetical protein
MHPERVELLSNAEFVRDREIDAFTLRTVTQGCVIDFDLRFHKMAHEKTTGNIPEFGGTGKSQNGESMGGWQKRGVGLTASATTRRFARVSI